ncbi:hypothetical protein, partial [Klebsiella pneumoniae]|uniref:hypothetical protein n=1 Tax=Klebsiella pneumoniae TaxID=573 RepID=UPI003A8810EA
AENSIPTIQLGSNNCGSLSIEDCANFDFSIPGNIIFGNYKIVVEILPSIYSMKFHYSLSDPYIL